MIGFTRKIDEYGISRKAVVIAHDFWDETAIIIYTIRCRDYDDRSLLGPPESRVYHLTNDNRWVLDFEGLDDEQNVIESRRLEHPIEVARNFIIIRRKPPAQIAESDLEIARDRERYEAWLCDKGPEGYRAWRARVERPPVATGGGRGRTTPLDKNDRGKLKPCQSQAYQSYCHAIRMSPELKGEPYKKIHSWLETHGCEQYQDDSLPRPASWERFLRAALRHHGEPPRKQPRAGAGRKKRVQRKPPEPED
jgi:hypothetical protein